ncbi:MAG TPA: hypothetical protein VG755_26870 [Nannocystaceae bacterium]|nr:hypothetical protein [Nannocystaceae bacterium]
MHRITLLCTLVGAGCYAPKVVDGTGTDASTGTASESGSVETTLTTTPTGESDSDPSMTSNPSTTVDPDSTTATTELGPQIVMSIPSDGDTHAPLGQFFLVYFDRVVGIDDAVGHIYVSQDGGDPMPISPMPCPPDADPTCIAGIFPASFLDDDGNLPGGTAHTIVVGAGFPDPDGNMNTMDQSIAFTTFEYEPTFFDDSDAFSNEFGGLAYSPAAATLYLVGEQAGGGGCLVRGVRLVDGAPQPAESVAQPSGSSLCYGADAFNDELWVAGSYSSSVYRYDVSGVPLPLVETITSPMLPPPLDNLDEVWSTAPSAGGVLFAHGEFFGATENSSILQRANGTWSEWKNDSDWSNANGVTIASIDGGTVYALADGQIFSMDETGLVIAQSQLDILVYDDDLHVDSAGRVWIGTESGVYVLDGGTFEQIDARLGFSASRIALREDGNTVHVYFARFRDVAVVGHVAFEL